MGLQQVISNVQTLWQAKGAKWCDKDYVVSFLTMINEQLEQKFAAVGLSYSEEFIILPNVAAGTTDLSAFQAPGQQLGDMMSPYSLEWRLPGAPATQFAPVGRVDKVLDVDTINSPIEGIESYAWMGGIVQISPSSVNVDIRVGCELLPDVFQSDSDNYIKGATNVLSFWTAGIIGLIRGAGASKLGTEFTKMGDSAWDDIESVFIMQEQETPRRLAGSRSRVPGPLWRLPRCD